MKRTIILVTAAVLVGVVVYNVFAAEKTCEGMMMSHKVEGKGSMMCPMCPMMCKAMMEKALAVTEDGDVILLAGCKLIKYDKDLNKVKEVELEMDTAGTQEKMQSMMKSCPMCKCMAGKPEGMMMPMKSTEKPVAEHQTSEHPK